ncbi:MAG TPA: transglutaminase family protein [Myxococcales bacterium]
MRVLLQHRSRYVYARPTLLGPHLIRLRPAAHARAKIESYGLRVTEPGEVRWQQDPAGNFVARASWADSRVPELEVSVELAVDIRPVNPFDFTLDGEADDTPFDYGPLAFDLKPYLDTSERAYSVGPRCGQFLESLPRAGRTVPLIVEINRRVNQEVRYVIREEPGIWTPEETLQQGRGSCRDSAVLLIAALRSRGLAARFASGYLVQLTDEGMLPDQPKGVSRDVVDLHAWAEVFLPGAGWIGLDATSGLLCGECHIPLACTALPQLAAPIEGTSEVRAEEVQFEVRIGRLGHEVRPTAPFTEEGWAALQAAGTKTDAKLRELGIALTVGGEPTFNSRLHPNRPEWNGEALGTTKWEQGLLLARQLLQRLLPGGLLLLRQGKHYPGESLPRWTLELIGRKDLKPLWSVARDVWQSAPGTPRSQEDAQLLPQARKLIGEIARRCGLPDETRSSSAGGPRSARVEGARPDDDRATDGFIHQAFEDPWRFLQDEAALPVGVDPLAADLRSSEERRRLARVLDRGLATPAGYVLPLARTDGAFHSERWPFRRERLYLLQGDSPIGLRLPLASLPKVQPPAPPSEEPFSPPDPRSSEGMERTEKIERERYERLAKANGVKVSMAPQKPPRPKPLPAGVRTALCVEPRGGALCVFLPPFQTAEDFLAVVAAVDAARPSVDAPVLLEGYPPPRSEVLRGFSVTPDPGVLEVNLPPVKDFSEGAALIETVFDAALHAGLHAEKYLLDGRQAGSGGGNHITLGGPTPLQSPFLRDPKLLASLVTFTQHHPSLSYLFSGLFVGATSQAPRVDEARHDALYEMEIALDRAFSQAGPPPPWLSDALFRNLLVDVTGNTHRAELCIDKLFDYRTPHGRQGLVELRAFEMPPHPRMAVAQVQLVRALVAAFSQAPYRAPLVRWGQQLHDRFLLPTWMWADFEDVLAFLHDRGLPHPADAYRAFLELRCPVAGQMHAGGVVLEIRNALEPWNVLGEEPSASGTSRYVDSSVERVEVRCEGLIPGRHEVLVNGYTLKLLQTGRAGEAAAGVRFRAWAPPHSLHPHLPVHHPLRFDVVDRWAQRSLGACAYHVWHPEGRAYDTEPLTRFEASARRAQRFTLEAMLQWPIQAREAQMSDDTPWTLDLRRLPADKPSPFEERQ